MSPLGFIAFDFGLNFLNSVLQFLLSSCQAKLNKMSNVSLKELDISKRHPVFETVVPEVIKTTGQKFIEVPQMVVTKQLVPEVVETVVEKKFKKIVQEVPEIQIQYVEQVVPIPQVQEVIKAKIGKNRQT